MGARSTAKVIEQTNTLDPIGNKTTNGVSSNIDFKSDPILRKAYAAYLLMNTELSDTVLNSITGKELVYAIAITSGLPGWFINFVNSINDCQFNNSTIETLTKYVSVPDWLSEVVNAWLKIKSSNN